MGSILDNIDNTLNINSKDFERYYSIGNTFKLTSIRNCEFINKLPVTRPFHDTWLDMIFDVERICSNSDDFNHMNIFGDEIIYNDLRYALGIRSMEISPIHKFVLAALLNTIYENNSVIYKLNECKSKEYLLDEVGFFIEGAIVDMDLDEAIMNFLKNKRRETFSTPVKVVKIVFGANLDKDIRMMTIQIPYMFDNGNYVHEGMLEFYFNKRTEIIFNI